LKRIDDLLQEDRPSRVRLKIPQKEGKLLALLGAKAVIIFRTYREGNVHLEVEAPESVLRKVKEFVK
jgi:50S ribosomal subunit-associated GTPase HflX